MQAFLADLTEEVDVGHSDGATWRRSVDLESTGNSYLEKWIEKLCTRTLQAVSIYSSLAVVIRGVQKNHPDWILVHL